MECDKSVNRSIHYFSAKANPKNSTDTRSEFGFALPSQVLNAIKVYCAHFYGSPLWDLYGVMANQVYKSWNTTVKLVWDLPRSTHNYFVEHHLAETFSSVRQSILAQYVGFIQRLERSGRIITKKKWPT
jgi:hypothetical protein